MVSTNDPTVTVSSCSLSTDPFPAILSTCSQNDGAVESETLLSPFSPASNRLAPLSGKKIFMHYDSGTNPDKSVEKVLVKLKAEIVDFFSRDVHYVITTRLHSRISRGSPLFNGSSQTPVKSSAVSQKLVLDRLVSKRSHKETVVAKSSPFSPGNIVNPSFNRGRAMLMAVAKKAAHVDLRNSLGVTGGPKPSSILRQIQPNSILESTTMQLNNPSSSPVTTGDFSNRSPVTDLLDRARKLGIRVLTMESVVKWIRNLPSDLQTYINSADTTGSDEHDETSPEDPERDRIFQVRHLTTPCVKVLDLEHQYRPLYLDRSDYLPSLWNWPTRTKAISKESAVDHWVSQNTGCSGSVPAASAGLMIPANLPSHPMTPPPAGVVQSILSRQNSRKKRKVRQQAASKKAHPLQRSTSVSGRLNCQTDQAKAAADEEEEPSGYCECCSVGFSSLIEHIQCPDHRQFANNDGNYKMLDDVLCKLPSFSQFIASESARKQSTKRRSVTKRRRHPSGLKSSMKVSGEPITRPLAVSLPDDVPLSMTSNKPPNDVVTPQRPPCLTSINGTLAVTTDCAHVHLFSDDDDALDAICLEVDSRSAGITDQTVLHHDTPPVTSSSDQSHVVIPELFFPLSVDCPRVPQMASLVQCAVDDCSVEQHHGPRHPSFINNPELIEAWQSVCDQVCVSESFRKPQPTVITDPNMAESPVLDRHHLPCSACHRFHIPKPLPDDLQLRLHTLFGPGSLNLTNLGCTGRFDCISDVETNVSPQPIDRPESLSSTGNDGINLSQSPVSVVSHSPVFDQTLVDHTLSTTSMRHLSAMDQDLSSSLSSTIIRESSMIPLSECVGLIPLASTPRVLSGDNSVDSLNISEPELLPPSPSSVRSEIVGKRRSLKWLFGMNSFDAKLPTCDNTECIDECASAVSVSSFRVKKKARKFKSSDRRPLSSVVQPPVRCSTIDQESLHHLAAVTRSQLDKKSQTARNRSPVLVESDVLRTTDLRRTKRRKCATLSSPPRTPPRIPRLAARVARESISLTVTALFSPTTIDRNIDRSRQPHSPLPFSLSSLKKIAVNSSHSSTVDPRSNLSPRLSRSGVRFSKKSVLFPH